MQVISLSALCPQSGKDTLADFIKTIEGIDVRCIAFGDALRAEIVSYFNTTGATFHPSDVKQMLLRPAKDVEHEAFSINKLRIGSYRDFMKAYVKWNPEEITKPRSLRYHLQRYGNDFTKDHMKYKSRWVDEVRLKLDDWRSRGLVDLVVVTDTRAPEEFEMLKKEFDATTFLIRREGFPVSEHEMKRVPHPIEEYAKNFKYDWELTNVYGDKSHMQADFMNIMNNYM